MSQPRRAISLIEMLAVMSILSTLLVGLSVWLVSLLRASDAGREHLLALQSQDRLARQFRQDVHRAENWSRPAGGAQAIVQLSVDPRQIINYRLEGGRLVREESRDGTRLRRESYVLPRKAIAALETADQSPATLLTLVIEPQGAQNRDGSPRTTRIAAQLGWLRQFAPRSPREDAP